MSARLGVGVCLPPVQGRSLESVSFYFSFSAWQSLSVYIVFQILSKFHFSMIFFFKLSMQTTVSIFFPASYSVKLMFSNQWHNHFKGYWFLELGLKENLAFFFLILTLQTMTSPGFCKLRQKFFCSKQTSQKQTNHKLCPCVNHAIKSKSPLVLASIQTPQSPLTPRMSSRLTTKTMTQPRVTMTRLLRGSVALNLFS